MLRHQIQTHAETPHTDRSAETPKADAETPGTDLQYAETPDTDLC